MKFTAVISAAVLSWSCTAAPLKTRQTTTVTDTDVLQFALTLEHLENVFYKQALAKFTEQDFTNAGFTTDTLNNIKFIAFDEQSHVQFLTQAISSAGGQPVAACQYNFGTGLDDVKSFVGLSSVLEGIGVSAYLGGAPVITSKDTLSAAGAVLVAEGLHQGIARNALNEVPSANIAGTGVGPNGIFTLASNFISSCPQSNAALPFKAFPQLNAITPQPSTASSVQSFTAQGDIPQGSFITFVSGLDTISVQGNIQNGQISAAIPDKIMGQTYVFVTNADTGGKLQDSQIVSGPAIIEVTPPAPTVDNSVQK